MSRIDFVSKKRSNRSLSSFVRARKEAIKTAKELHYPEEIIEALKKAKTEEKVSRILRSARELL